MIGLFSTLFDKFTLFMLILIRMSGAILVNPLFGRRNVPTNIKIGITLMMSLLLTSVSSQAEPQMATIVEFIYRAGIEFLIGYAMSFVMDLFFSSILIAADLMDVQMGIGMSKVFDPGSNVSEPITGSLFNTFLILLFFVTNGHITFFKLLCDSVTAIPCGSDINLTKAAYAAAGLLTSSLTLALKFAFPIIAIEFITETGMGVLTRAVPNINVFSVGMQLKLIVGFVVLILISPVFGSFCDALYKEMFSGITGILRLMT